MKFFKDLMLAKNDFELSKSKFKASCSSELFTLLHIKVKTQDWLWLHSLSWVFSTFGAAKCWLIAFDIQNEHESRKSPFRCYQFTFLPNSKCGQFYLESSLGQDDAWCTPFSLSVINKLILYSWLFPDLSHLFLFRLL